jgi:hypothetical protein
MTAANIMELLELKDWGAFAKKARYKNLNDRERTRTFSKEHLLSEKDRMTGRSTRMLVSALVVMSKGMSVNILGYGSSRNPHSVSSALRHRLKELADSLGIDPTLVRLIPGADVEFFDHTYWESWSG